jgi:hypothetical protein
MVKSFDSCPKGSGFEPHDESGDFVLLGKALNTETDCTCISLVSCIKIKIAMSTYFATKAVIYSSIIMMYYILVFILNIYTCKFIYTYSYIYICIGNNVNLFLIMINIHI